MRAREGIDRVQMAEDGGYELRQAARGVAVPGDDLGEGVDLYALDVVVAGIRANPARDGKQAVAHLGSTPRVSMSGDHSRRPP